MRICFAVFSLRRILTLVIIPTLLVSLAIASLAASSRRALSGWLIAIDAGHGGHDHGAWFPDHGILEKEITLQLATKLGNVFAESGAAVVLVRDDDTFVELSERANRANKIRARMFLSLHVNRYPGDPNCCGAQTFYQNDAIEGKYLATLIQEHLRRIDPENHRQPLPANFQVLRESQMPAALIEIGFATNARDRRLMMDNKYREGVVYAIRDAVIAYSRSTPSAL
jgi:N-acetylmuramoyl-L-alanine amidase